MAIADMTRIRLYGLQTERESILAELMRSGAVQLEDALPLGAEVPTQPEDEILHCMDEVEQARATDALVAETSFALNSLDRHAPLKKGLFPFRRRLSGDQFTTVLSRRESLLGKARHIRLLEDHLAERKTEENRLIGQLDFLRPWCGIGVDLSVEQTRHTRLQAGTLPANQSTSELGLRLCEAAPAAQLFLHKLEGDAQYCVILWHRHEEEAVTGLLKESNWNRIGFRELPGNPDSVTAELKKRQLAISLEKKGLIEEICALAPIRDDLETLHDALLMERDRLAACSRIAATGKTFLLRGWAPASAFEPLQQRLNQSHTCLLAQDLPAKDEEVPVLIRSNGLTEAIRPVMDMYGTPSSREIDPNFLTLPFFAIFFGLIMSDAGYGLILAGSATFVLLRFKLEDTIRRFAKLILFCGLTTIFWGVLFGGFFGIEAFAAHAVWFAPGGKGGTEQLMVWCLLFGVIHLFTGMGMKAANLIRRGHILDALCDVGFPYVMFTGFGMTVLPNVPGLDAAATAPISRIGLYVLLVGVVLVVATAGRKSKSLAGKLLGGLPRLYDIIGFLGDVLSYMRLLALSLAGGILGGLINGMASGFGNLAAKIIGGTLLLLLGHGINFAMSVLGAFVHSCRLQYLEFFTKFLEGGGTPFRPFGPDTRYTLMKQED